MCPPQRRSGAPPEPEPGLPSRTQPISTCQPDEGAPRPIRSRNNRGPDMAARRRLRRGTAIDAERSCIGRQASRSRCAVRMRVASAVARPGISPGGLGVMASGGRCLRAGCRAGRAGRRTAARPGPASPARSPRAARCGRRGAKAGPPRRPGRRCGYPVGLDYWIWPWTDFSAGIIAE